MARQESGEPYMRISAKEAALMLEEGKSAIVDVRNRDEYESGHVKGAVWIPVDEVIPRYNELPEDGKIMFICQIGARSGLAAEYAAAMGADPSRLFNIEDGTPGWMENQLPVSYGSEA